MYVDFRKEEAEAYKPLLRGMLLVTCSATPSSNNRMDAVLHALSLALCDVKDSTTQPNQTPMNVLTTPPASVENRPCTGTMRALKIQAVVHAPSSQMPPKLARTAKA